MTETAYIKRIHRQLSPDVYKWKIKDDYAGGVPDAWYCGNEGTLFVEYKYIATMPKRPTTLMKANLSELQMIWIKDRQAQGQDVVVILGSPDGAVIFERPNEAKAGIPMSSFIERMHDAKEIARYIETCTI